MLSIGKVGLARNQQLYYEDKVARGAEDYYAGRGEVAGRWVGAGAALLGLEGEVETEGLRAMMDGKDPLSGIQLARRTGRSSTAALDLTFSAPKSVSVLFAVGDERLSRSLVDAHEEAVDAALSYVERDACRVRRGHNGTEQEREAGRACGWQRARLVPAAGFVAAAYRHRMSRAQDPQLHTHVVCANMARGPDGRWTALDGRAIYRHAKAAGCVYEAHLRRTVRERLPWAAWGPVREGIAELEQVPAEVREEFSQRRRRILEREQELEAAGVAVGPAGRDRIALDTREAKREVAEADWRSEIRARAGEHGLGQEEVKRLARLPAAPAVETVTEPRLAGELFSANGLTEKRNTFETPDVVIAVAQAHREGARTAEVLALSRRVLHRSEVVRLPDALEQRYTTRELVRAEELIVGHASEGRAQDAGVLTEAETRLALSGLEPRLTASQRDVVLGIVISGHRVDTVEALAGTGKTTCAAAVAALYHREGYRVLGAAPTARALRELKERAGITDARTLDGWALKLTAQPGALATAEPGEAAGPRGAVLVIDEAGMAPTRVSAEVIDNAMASGVKVVAIGDSGQLSSVRAGGWLGALTRRFGSHELREVMRQRDPVERRALAKVHRGDSESYLSLKTGRGELCVFSGERAGVEGEQALLERWASARDRYGPTGAVMVCRDNARRARLNELARAWLRDHGELGPPVTLAGREWEAGERVIARRNDRDRDLDNGMRGTITHLDQHAALIALDSGQTREVDAEYLAAHVEPAFAVTSHGMQGGTVEWAGVIGHPGDFSRNWSYTALSRAREPAEIFLIDEPTPREQDRADLAPAHPTEASHDPVERMRRRMRERDDEDLALEHLKRENQSTNTKSRLAATPTAPDVRAARRAGDRDHDVGPPVSPHRDRLYALEQELHSIHARLADPAIPDAQTIKQLEDTIAAIEQEHQRDRNPTGWRDRTAHRTRKSERQQHLTQLNNQRARLLEQDPKPDQTLQRAERLRERGGAIAAQCHATRRAAIREELAAEPPWLASTLGPEPTNEELRELWHKTAREIAGHRIDNHLTDPQASLNRHAREHDLERAIAETRAALGLEADTYQADLGRER